MSAETITTVVKMLESLPDDLQDRVAEHLREYIADLEDKLQPEYDFTQLEGVVRGKYVDRF
jgi:hypothetical protein